MDAFELKPKYGFGNVKFGMTREEVKQILGEPDQEELETFSDDYETYFLEYDELGLTLGFGAEDDFLLGMISVSDERYRIGSERLIGKTPTQLQNLVKNAGISDLEYDEEMSDDERQSYYSDEHGISFNIFEGEVEEIVLLSDCDDDGNPIWP
jgi:hypothetical protein